MEDPAFVKRRCQVLQLKLFKLPNFSSSPSLNVVAGRVTVGQRLLTVSGDPSCSYTAGWRRCDPGAMKSLHDLWYSVEFHAQMHTHIWIPTHKELTKKQFVHTFCKAEDLCSVSQKCKELSPLSPEYLTLPYD